MLIHMTKCSGSSWPCFHQMIVICHFHRGIVIVNDMRYATRHTGALLLLH